MKSQHTFQLLSLLAVALVLPLLSGCASADKTKDAMRTDRVKQLEVKRIGPDYLVRITGNQKPTFTVFRLLNPTRIVVDLANYDVRPLAKPRTIQTGEIARIRGRQFGDESLGIGRLEVTLRSLADFDSWTEDESVVIRIKPARVDMASLKLFTQADDGILLDEQTTGEDVLLEEEFIEDLPDDEVFGDSPEESLTEGTTPQEPAAEDLVVEPPAPSPAPTAPTPVVEELELEEVEDIVEAPVVDEAPLPAIVEEDEDEKLAQDTLEGIDQQQIEKAAQPAPPVQASQLIDVAWAIEPSATIITIDGNGPFGDYNAFKLEGPARIVVDVWNVASLIPGDQFDVNSTQVKSIRVGDYPEKVRIVIDVPGESALPFEASKSGNSLSIKITGTPVQPSQNVAVVEEPEPVIEVAKVETAPPATAEPAQPAPVASSKPSPAPTAPLPRASQPQKVEPVEEIEPIPQPKKQNIGAAPVDIRLREKPKTLPTSAANTKKYEGRRISLDFKDADIDSVLRLIAEISNLNIITDEEVSGTISLRLVNVPWDQALDVALAAKQLGMRKLGNIVRVAPLDKLSKEDEQRLKSLEDQELLLPLYIRVVPVNYADAKDIANRIKPLLSSRGKVDVDARTNVLIIKDIERNLEDSITLVRSLDSPTPQVLIEAKIVEANTTFTRELGVQWGYGQSMAPEFGNRNLPGRVGIAGNASNGLVGPAGAGDPNFAVDLPAAVGTGSGGALGFVFGSLDNSTILDLRLTALESSGEGRIISSPRITTLDNEKAKITQGISIPFQTVSAEGTQTQFVDAALELEVTPHITPDRSVLLEFKIRKNAPDQTFTAGTGVPSISKKEAESRMLVADGETAVVGGIFTMDQGSNVASVPWLNKIPVLGWFFKKRSTRETKTELLLFVTPRVVVD